MFWNKIFSHKNLNDKPLSRTERLLAELSESENKCNSEKKEAETDIETIKKWAKELILSIYDVPKKFWYEELRNYDKIKAANPNSNINPQIVSKTDAVINGYREQIKMRQAKIEFCSALNARYENLKSKLESIKAKDKQSKIDSQKMDLLESHTERIKKMNESGCRPELAYEKNETLKFMDDDLSEIEAEYQTRSQIQNMMLELNHSLTESNDFSSESYISALEELNSNLSKDT